MSEMTSTLPFAGGPYGLTRCSMGFYFGFLIGCCEAIQYIVYVSSSVLTFGQMFLEIFPDVTYPQTKSCIWLLVFFVSSILQLQVGRVFWRFNLVLAIVSLLIVVIYVLGTLAFVDYTTPVPPDQHFIGGFSTFMQYLPWAAWFYVGIEALNTTCKLLKDPKTVIPGGQIPSMLTLLLCAFPVFFVAVYLNPTSIMLDDGLKSQLACFNPGIRQFFFLSHLVLLGFMKMFGLTRQQAMILSFPATFATIYGFILAYSNVISGLASSKLLPHILQNPAYANIAGSVIGFFICFLVDYTETVSQCFLICIMFGFMAYTSQCIGYIYLRNNFKHLNRSYRSPLGIPGAVYSMCIWILNLIALLFFQDDYLPIAVTAVIIAVLTLLYYGYARHHQQFSEDERKLLFFVHIAMSKIIFTHRSYRMIFRSNLSQM
jgi:amino acid transporter